MLRFWVLREINSPFCSKTQWQMFLLVSSRHVGAHLGGHQHGVSIQISINLGKTFLCISAIRKIAVTWILVRVFVYLPSFYFQILDLMYWTVLIFYLGLFWMAWHWKPAIGWQLPTHVCQSFTRLIRVYQHEKVGEKVGENRGKFYLSPTVCQRVCRLFLCRSHTPTWVCQHEFANFSLTCEGRFRGLNHVLIEKGLDCGLTISIIGHKTIDIDIYNLSYIMSHGCLQFYWVRSN